MVGARASSPSPNSSPASCSAFRSGPISPSTSSTMCATGSANSSLFVQRPPGMLQNSSRIHGAAQLSGGEETGATRAMSARPEQALLRRCYARLLEQLYLSCGQDEEYY